MKLKIKRFDAGTGFGRETPLSEQVRAWLNSRPDITVKEIKMDEREALLLYEHSEPAAERPLEA
ncbi:hypothetical protein [Evansella clarkii]|uniref:hypothetical protein n=1 Tax=Evansella clarkii TaxID=79879 RepID=UPI0009962EAC|nr:hypothetical protein [Evansella clarkii]